MAQMALQKVCQNLMISSCKNVCGILLIMICIGLEDDALNNGTHTSSAELPVKEEDSSTAVAEEVPPVENSKQNAADESSILNEDTEISTNSVLNDSVMAVYGGKDETFMESSTLEQSVDMTPEQGNESLACNSTSNSSTQDVIKTEESSAPQENQEVSTTETTKEAPSSEEMDASAQEETPVPVKTEEAVADTKVTEPQVDDSKAEVDLETPIKEECDETQGAVSPSKGQTGTDKTDRGSKRQRDRYITNQSSLYCISNLNILYASRSSSPANVNKVVEGPPPEDEPEWDSSLVILDWYNSDLNLIISKTDFMSAAPLTEAGFAYMWAGARATYGFIHGKIYYEVKVRIDSYFCF